MNKTLSLLVFLLIVFSHSGYGQSEGQSQDSIELTEINDLLYVQVSDVKNDTLQRLNLVIPEGSEEMPLLMWIGGGAWAYVDRDMEMDLVRQFARKGMAVASVGHRLSTAIWVDSLRTEGIQHPGHVEDVAAAFKWLYDHADEYGYDRDRIVVGGFSSGGHLAALLSMDTTYLAAVGLTREHIRGVIPIGGAYDIQQYHQVFLEGSRPELAEIHVEAVFGNTAEGFRHASPTTYVDSMQVPMLLISENQTFNYTRIFEEAIQESGFNDLSVVHVEEMGHGEFWNHLSQADSSEYRDLIASFILTERKLF